MVSAGSGSDLFFIPTRAASVPISSSSSGPESTTSVAAGSSEWAERIGAVIAGLGLRLELVRPPATAPATSPATERRPRARMTVRVNNCASISQKVQLRSWWWWVRSDDGRFFKTVTGRTAPSSDVPPLANMCDGNGARWASCAYVMVRRAPITPVPPTAPTPPSPVTVFEVVVVVTGFVMVDDGGGGNGGDGTLAGKSAHVSGRRVGYKSITAA